MAQRQDTDHYKTLGIDRAASQDEIRAAYRRLGLRWHPDRNSSPEAEARMKRINAAYEVLRKSSSRSRYDRETFSSGSSGSTRSAGREREQTQRRARERQQRERAQQQERERQQRERAQQQERERQQRERAQQQERERAQQQERERQQQERAQQQERERQQRERAQQQERERQQQERAQQQERERQQRERAQQQEREDHATAVAATEQELYRRRGKWRRERHEIATFGNTWPELRRWFDADKGRRERHARKYAQLKAAEQERREIAAFGDDIGSLRQWFDADRERQQRHPNEYATLMRREQERQQRHPDEYAAAERSGRSFFFRLLKRR